MYTPYHIKGHQDDDAALKDLDRFSLLNIECDFYAKDYWRVQYWDKKAASKRYFTYTIPMGMWKVSISGIRVINELKSCLIERIVGSKSALFIIQFFKVDWYVNTNDMSSVRLSRRHWVTIFQSGFCGTGRMMKGWKQRVIDNCPRCGAVNETTTHILQCPCADAQEIWATSLASLD